MTAAGTSLDLIGRRDAPLDTAPLDLDAELVALWAQLPPHLTPLHGRVPPAFDLEHAPRFSAHGQLVLTLTYQRGLLPEATASHRRDGQTAAAYLLGSVYILVHQKILGVVTPRTPTHEVTGAVTQLLSLAYSSVLEAAATYTPTRSCSVVSFMMTSLGFALPAAFDQTTRLGFMPPTWSRVAQVSRGVLVQATQEGRTLSMVQLQAETHARCQQWAADRLTPEDKLLPLEQQQVLSERRLVRQGFAAALRELPQIYPVMAPERWLDANHRTDNGTTAETLRDTIPGGDDPAEIVEAESDLALQRLFVALAMGPDDTRGDNDSLSPALQRVRAPHAQYAYLAPDVNSLITGIADSEGA